jgi:tRNA(Ile)-lysidine synthase
MPTLETKLQNQLAPHDWQSVTALVAVSGGADSVALLRGLAALRKPSPGRLVVVHFNHQLRGEQSDRDEAFVADLAKRLGLAFVVRRGDGAAIATRGDSMEASARDARYQFFEAVAGQQGARYLFMAHTADDQAETILHRIVRGTGLAGLAGIPRVRPLSGLTTIVRPLLDVRRSEVLHYLAELGQDFREDETNTDPRFTRNRLRHELLPQLARDYNPQVVDALLRLGELAGDVNAIVDERLQQVLDTVIIRQTPQELRINVARIMGQPASTVRMALVRAWRAQGWPLQQMGFEKWQSLAALALSPENGVLNLPGNIRAQKQGEQLSLTRPVG